MTTEYLYEFLILARIKNYTKASAHLFISQPVLSRHIMEMEKELGILLFVRDTHSLNLTPAGTYLSEHAGEFLNDCDSACQMIRAKGLSTDSTIRIICAPELAYSNHIQIFFRHFKERYPDVPIDFVVRPDGLPSGLLETCDILFSPCEYTDIPSSCEKTLLSSHLPYVFLSPGHPLVGKPSITLQDLSDETFIMPFTDEYFGPYAQFLLLVQMHSHGRTVIRKVPNLSTAIFLVSAGEGISIVPRYVQYMVSQNTFLRPLSGNPGRFNEYIYLNRTEKNGAAGLFYKELVSSVKSV